MIETPDPKLKMIARRLPLLTAFAFLLHPVFLSRAQQQGGNLTPPGAPAVTMKSLDKIDPGTALDPANAPFTIDVAGSYYLTGNVTTVAATQAVFTIDVSNVTLNLRGFSLVSAGGTGTATSHSAIFVSSSSRLNIAVRNGHVDGNWYAGLYAAGSTVVAENLQIRRTNEYGIRLGDGARVAGCHVDGGAALGSGFVSTAGIQCQDESIILNSTARRCDGGGIDLNLAGGSILDCTAKENMGIGIDTGASCTVSRCVSTENIAAGINVGFGCVVSACVSFSNDTNGFEAGSSCTFSQCAAYMNLGAGFTINAASILAGCVSFQNGDDGFICSSATPLAGCVAFDNSAEGFDLVSNHVLTGCTASGNDDNGFSGASGNVFSNCVARSNGVTAVNAAADGFEISNANRIRDCVSASNQGMGIRANSTLNDFRDNQVSSNSSGGISLTSTSNLVIGNYVPSNSSFNINPTPAGDIGPLEDAFTGTSPNANFQ